MRKNLRFVWLMFVLVSLCAGKSAAQPNTHAAFMSSPTISRKGAKLAKKDRASTGQHARLVQKETVRRSAPIFVFHADEFWLNLHHFLYVLGRAENKTRDGERVAVVYAPVDQEKGLALLKPNERRIWREAVSWYAAGPSRRDLVFDAPLPRVTNALMRSGGAKSPTGAGVDPSLAAVLVRAAPLYRKAWWPKHYAANQAWQNEIQSLAKQYGTKILAFITHKYQMEWPAAGYDVHLSAYANWAGAYSTEHNLLVVSSLNEETRGRAGLETVFHEGMHQWDDSVAQILADLARRTNNLVPDRLSHALIFFSAGEAVRHVIPDHVRYADNSGVWQRGMIREKDALEEIWKPYLDGRGTRDEALTELIKRLAL